VANPQLDRLIERLTAARAQSSECCPRDAGRSAGEKALADLFDRDDSGKVIGSAEITADEHSGQTAR
jgi:hypothetical protein